MCTQSTCRVINIYRNVYTTTTFHGASSCYRLGADVVYAIHLYITYLVWNMMKLVCEDITVFSAPQQSSGGTYLYHRFVRKSTPTAAVAALASPSPVLQCKTCQILSSLSVVACVLGYNTHVSKMG